MIIKTYESKENGFIYIVNEYKNGTVEKYLKPNNDILEPVIEQLSQSDMQEQILLNTEYLVAMQELSLN